jgi:hypothetical protein
MARLLATILAALFLPAQARATLVVVVPSASGLVVAADSRESILGTECDGLFKIVEPRRPFRTVVMVTGDGVFVRPPDVDKSAVRRAEETCAYLQSAPRLLDISAVVTNYLERASVPFDTLALDDLSAACVEAVRRFQQADPQALETYAGRDVFSVVVAHYEPKPGTSTLLNFVVRIDAATHAILVDRANRTIISAQDRRGVWAFGETDYLNQNVYRGIGRKFLSESTQKFILEEQPIGKASLEASVGAAVNIVQAASRTAEIVTPPSGIGGPIDVVLLGKTHRPQTISHGSPDITIPSAGGAPQ